MDASPETLVDFHTHSHYSDGVLAPAALVERARTRKVGTLALTDHDTTAGLAEARAACAVAGIRFVPGVELSASWRGQTIHIVGSAGRRIARRLAIAPRRGPRATPGAPQGDRRAARKARAPAGPRTGRLAPRAPPRPPACTWRACSWKRGHARDTQEAFDRWLNRDKAGPRARRMAGSRRGHGGIARQRRRRRARASASLSRSPPAHCAS